MRGKWSERSSRRLRGLIVAASTMTLIMVMALPSRAATLIIDLPSRVVRADPGESILLHTETIPDSFVGQTCSVTAVSDNNSSVHPGNNIQVASGNVVTLFGVEDTRGQTTTANGSLSLTATVTFTLVMGEDGVYSAGQAIHLDCQAATTTTGETGPTSVTEPSTTTTTEAQVSPTEVTTSSTVPTEVGGTVVTNTTLSDEVEGTEVLPFTGSSLGSVILATIALALGTVLLVAARRDET